MTQATWERLFDCRHAFDDPFTLWAVVAIAAAAVLAGIVIQLLRRLKRISRESYDDAFVRWKSWVGLSVLIVAAILLGAAWTVAAVALLSLACYREYARATGLFREKAISAVIVLGIFLVTFAVVDHYDRLFFALGPLTVALIAAVTVPSDRPRGYIQRVALGVFAFLMFGFSLGYLGNIANAVNYRPILLMIFIGVEGNDIFAYCTGKMIAGPKLLPGTSPGKTLSGSIGALLLTTILVASMAHFIFADTAVDTLPVLISLGILIGGLGQLGDLVLSSIKRDVGIKDTGTIIPGHGGLLDRFDSLILVPPAVFHYLSYYLGPLGSEETTRIFTGG